MGRSAWPLALTSILCFAPGCGPTGPPTYPVSGTVLVEGRPLAEGDIIFLPTAEDVGPDHGKIKNGEFHFRAKPGRKRVKITCSSDPAGTNRPYLTAEVSADGANQFEFSLPGDK